ncbi:sulfotransferase domain-containing protein [Hyphococcus sp.]|uniref:sulfotransferase domain-containing protein n=1 Tax=Hyphococcus sp. TaxID=2038636 RepID=UPI003D0EAB6B
MSQTLLVCIGAQKAGTTWLADYLRAHPQAHMPPVKEVHFFDARFVPQWCAKYEEEMLAEYQRLTANLTLATCGDPIIQQRLHAMLLRFRMIANPNEYLRFMSWGAQGRPVLFEATPDYSMLDGHAFSVMRDIHPDVRLIFLLRNPADRFWSSMKFNQTHNPMFDIDVMFDRLIGREDFQLLGNYERTFEEVLKAFSPERLHVEFYERLFTQRAVDRICAFAGIKPKPADFGARSNASIEGEMPPARREQAVRAYAHVYRGVNERFQGDLPENWRQDMQRFGI